MEPEEEDFATPEVDRTHETIVKIDIEKWIQAISCHPPEVVITFNKNLDTLLGGGFPRGYITEIFGAKGTGKSTLCMQACITAQLPKKVQGLEWKPLYIDTDKGFTKQRIGEMVQACVDHCGLVTNAKFQVSAEEIMKNLSVIPCKSLEQFRTIIRELDSYLEAHPKVRMIIIDSLSSLYGRHHLFSKSADKIGGTRSKSLYYFAQELYRLANKFGLVVLVTSNVTSRFGAHGRVTNVPSLGPSWIHLPQIRLELSTIGDARRAELKKHFQPIPRKSVVEFTIRKAGIR